MVSSSSSRSSSKAVSSHVITSDVTDADSIDTVSTVAQQAIASASQSVVSPEKLPPVGYCPMSREEISAHSCLKEPIIEKLPLINDMIGYSSEKAAVLRLAANFIGGGLITGGKGEFELDGIFQLPNFHIWRWLLDDLIKSRPDADASIVQLEAARAGIDQLIEYAQDIDDLLKEHKHDEEKLQEVALKYVTIVHELEPGESQMFSGGWSNVGGGSGHAQIYEIKRNEDNTFDFFLYTSTGYQLADSILIGDKHRLKPVIRYSGIPEEQVCFNSDGILRAPFFQHMMEVSVLASWDIDRTADEEDVLEVFDHLERYRTPVSWDEVGAITGQRAGTCTVSSTKVWLRHLFGSSATYKHEKIEIDFRMLLAVYQSLKEEIPQDSYDGDVSRRLLNHQARNFCRAIAKGIELGYLDDPEFAQMAQATAYDVIDEILIADKAITEQRRARSFGQDLSALNMELQRAKRKKWYLSRLDMKQKGAESKEQLSKIEASSESAGKAITAPPLIYLPKEITTPQEFIEEAKEVIASPSSLGIYQLIDQLPIPDVERVGAATWIESLNTPFWDKLNAEEINEVLLQLHDIAKVYETFADADQPTRCYATLMTLHSLTHFLAVKVESLQEREGTARLDNYKIFSLYKHVNSLEGLVFYNRNEFLRFEKGAKYFLAFNEQAQGPELFRPDKDGSVKKYVIEGSDNGKYWQAIIESDAKFREHIDRLANEKWPDLTEDEIAVEYKNFSDRYKRKRADGYAGSQHPKRQVNLLQSTKRTLLLEEFSYSQDKAEQSLNFGKGYSQVQFLRTMSRHMFSWTKEKALNRSDEISISRTSKYCSVGSKKVCIEYRDDGVYHAHPQSDVFKKQHRSFSDYKNKIFSNSTTSRFETTWEQDVAEGKTLIDGDDSKLTLNDRIIRACSEWKLTPYQLIMELGQNLEELSDPSLQASLFRLIFRSPVTKDGISHLGAGQLIIEDEALLQNVESFINKGLFYYLNKQEKEAINGARFFLELSFYFSKYLHDAGKHDKAGQLEQFGFIDQWLESGKLSVSDASVLHQYRILFFTLKNSEDMTDEEFVHFYTSWMENNICPDNPTWQSPELLAMKKNRAEILTSQISQRLEDDTDFMAIFVNGLTKALKLDSYTGDLDWSYNDSTGLLSTERPNGEEFAIDLVGGKVYVDFKLIGMGGADHRWERQRRFRRLFPDKTGINYISLGDDKVSFEHPEFGTILLIYMVNMKVIILRQFSGSGGTWFAFFDSDNILPPTLVMDHTFWVPIGEEINAKDGTKITGYIATLKEQKIRYAVTEEGLIVEVDSETGEPIPHGCVLDSLERGREGSTDESLRFDTNDHILCYSNQQNGSLERLTFPRYTTFEGSPLEFISRDGNMVWSENTRYALPSSMPEGYLGTICNYLYLQPVMENSVPKLLVPFQEITSFSKAPVPSGRLKVENKYNYLEDRDQELWENQYYFVYNVVRGEVQPTTVEGQLFLAYMQFSQKKYDQSIDWIRKIKPGETLTPSAIEILAMILTLPLGEDHPDAKMVYQHALYLKMKQMDKVATSPVESYFIDKDYSDYDIKRKDFIEHVESCLQSLNNISADCRMTHEEEVEFLKRLINEASSSIERRLENRLAYLQGTPVINAAGMGERGVAQMELKPHSFPYKVSSQFLVHLI